MHHLLALELLFASALVLCAPLTPARAQEDADELIDAALAHLDPLIGQWTGSGFLRAGPGTEELPHDCTWSIARSHGERFLRLEFVATSEAVRRHWVGYFTFDESESQYTTLWKSLDNNYEFHETGSFDAETNSLTLTSFQDRGEGKQRVEVRSIFTIDGPDAFHVVDSTKDPDSGEWYESFSFTLERRNQ